MVKIKIIVLIMYYLFLYTKLLDFKSCEIRYNKLQIKNTDDYKIKKNVETQYNKNNCIVIGKYYCIVRNIILLINNLIKNNNIIYDSLSYLNQKKVKYNWIK